MKGEHISAVEVRARWLQWAKGPGYSEWRSIANLGKEIQSYDKTFVTAFPNYGHVLEVGDSYFMNNAFMDLVDHAKASVPGDIEWDNSWMQSPKGFLWLARPFTTPQVQRIPDPNVRQELEEKNIEIGIQALGWMPAEAPDSTHFMCYINFEEYGRRGFGCWSYFTIRTGQKLIERMTDFERTTEKAPMEYVPDEYLNLNHEMRWVYTAFHLMAQRLAHVSQQQTDRNTRRRGQRTGLPVVPFLRVVSLRRLEEDREAHSKGDVDWQWQWAVRGHWRNQFYPSDNTHRMVFIEAYIKGPDGRPLKPPQHNLFMAVR